MTATRAIDADVTAAINRWTAAIGTPDHQAASEALDALLVDYCALRAASQRGAEVPEATELLALITLAAMDGYNKKPVSTVDEWMEEAKKLVLLVYLAGRNAVTEPTQRPPIDAAAYRIALEDTQRFIASELRHIQEHAPEDGDALLAGICCRLRERGGMIQHTLDHVTLPPSSSERRDAVTDEDVHALVDVTAAIRNDWTLSVYDRIEMATSMDALIRKLTMASNEDESAAEYHVRIIHKEARLGTEEHWCDLGKIQRFLNGHYANVQLGDEVIIRVPDPRTPPTGRAHDSSPLRHLNDLRDVPASETTE